MGYLGAVTVENALPSSWEMIWKQWDAIHYLAIADQGYASEFPFRLIFPPLYPLAVAAATPLMENALWAGLIISNLAFLVSLCLLHKLVRLDFDEKSAELTLLLLACFPAAYFFHAPYSESLFLALSLGSIYLARKQHWIWAGILGMLAALTRTPGFVLSAVLAAEYFHQVWQKQQPLNAKALLVGLPLLGFGLFLLLNFSCTGDPWHFLGVYHQDLGRHLAPPWEGFLNDWRGVSDSIPANALFIWGLNLGYFFLATGAVFAICWHLRFCYAVYAICTWIMVFCLNHWMSVPRHLMVCFPFFVITAALVKDRPLLRKVLFFTGLFLYFLGTIQFTRGQWAN